LINLSALYDQLPVRIERLHVCSANPRIAADCSKLAIDIEAYDFVASLSAWSNGCVDIDLLVRGATDGIAWHGEFKNTDVALQALVEALALLPNLPHLPGP